MIHFSRAGFYLQAHLEYIFPARQFLSLRDVPGLANEKANQMCFFLECKGNDVAVISGEMISEHNFKSRMRCNHLYV